MKAWRAAALGVCALVLAGNAWHILHHKAPPAWDDAWYLENSFRFYYALKQSMAAFAWEYVVSFKIKAPLISVLPLPFYWLFGPGERAALWVNQLALSLCWVFCYKIGRKLYGEKAGLLSVIFAALMPMLYGLSRIYLVECVLATLVTWTQWRILQIKEKERGFSLGLILGLGLLAKSLFPIYALSSIWLMRRELRPQAKTAALAAVLVAGTWYAFNWPYALGFAWSAGFGAIGKDYGPGGSGPWARFVSPQLQFLGQGLSFSCVAVFFSLILLNWRKMGELSPSKFLAGWFLLPWLAWTMGVNKELRYLAPALPALAIGLGACAASWASGRLRRSLLGLIILIPLGVFSSQTFGWPEARALAYNGPPSNNPGWDRAALVAAAARHAGPGSVIAVALEHPFLNANNLSSLAAAEGRGYRFINLGYAQSSAEGALIRLKDKSADFLILVRDAPKGDLSPLLNRANAGLMSAVRHGTLPTLKLESVPLFPGVHAELYRILGR
ncbi:MAG: glycosyltransferase family 39 protein [Elusimicrobia bacterium]|nr:glycosyltransferase family 39 protein [Elusimicrobiota bacterium]